MKRFLLLIFLVFTLWACQKEYRCGFFYYAKKAAKSKAKSEVLSFRRGIVSDSLQSNLHGVVYSTIEFGKKINKESETEVLPFVSIEIIDRKNKLIIKQETQINGKFSFNLLPATYDLKVKTIGYKDLVLRQVLIQEQEEINLEILLKAGIDSTVYKVKKGNQIVQI